MKKGISLVLLSASLFLTACGQQKEATAKDASVDTTEVKSKNSTEKSSQETAKSSETTKASGVKDEVGDILDQPFTNYEDNILTLTDWRFIPAGSDEKFGDKPAIAFYYQVKKADPTATYAVKTAFYSNYEVYQGKTQYLFEDTGYPGEFAFYPAKVSDPDNNEGIYEPRGAITYFLKDDKTPVKVSSIPGEVSQKFDITDKSHWYSKENIQKKLQSTPTRDDLLQIYAGQTGTDIGMMFLEKVNSQSDIVIGLYSSDGAVSAKIEGTTIVYQSLDFDRQPIGDPLIFDFSANQDW